MFNCQLLALSKVCKCMRDIELTRGVTKRLGSLPLPAGKLGQSWDRRRIGQIQSKEELMSIKDIGVSRIAEQVLKPFLRKYAELVDLSINSKEKQISLQLVPKGDNQIITLDITKYEIGSTNGKTKFTIREIAASKEWITNLAQDFLVGREFEIPDWAKHIL